MRVVLHGVRHSRPPDFEKTANRRPKYNGITQETKARKIGIFEHLLYTLTPPTASIVSSLSYTSCTVFPASFYLYLLLSNI
jgi:hypothetical protein